MVAHGARLLALPNGISRLCGQDGLPEIGIGGGVAPAVLSSEITRDFPRVTDLSCQS